MTPDHEKRNFVAGMYTGHGWKVKVAKMSDAQIFAIWKKEEEKLAQQEPKTEEKQDDIPF